MTPRRPTMSIKLPLDSLLEDAVARGGGVLHIEPDPGGAVVRLRRDLALVSLDTVGRDDYTTLWQNILDKFGPSGSRPFFEGSFRFNAAGVAYVIRVSMVPTPYGESIALKLNSRDRKVLELDALGLGPDDRDRFRRILAGSGGWVLLAAPPGGGGTTTLFSSLAYLGDGTRKIVSIELPIELHLAGVQQIDVSGQSDMGQGATSFAQAFRAVDQQDPDVIAMGCLRSAESASVAVQAAMSGALVLSRVHAVSPRTAIARLESMGVSRTNLSLCLRGVLAQATLKKVCSGCARRVPVGDLRREHPGVELGDLEGDLRTGTGCANCHGTGIDGVVPVFELVTSPADLEALLHPSRPADAAGPWGNGLLGSIRRKVAGGEVPVTEYLRWIA